MHAHAHLQCTHTHTHTLGLDCWCPPVAWLAGIRGWRRWGCCWILRPWLLPSPLLHTHLLQSTGERTEVAVFSVLTPPTGLSCLLLHTSRPGFARCCCHNNQAGTGAGPNSRPAIVYATCLACLFSACCVPCAALIPPLCHPCSSIAVTFFKVACGVVLSAAPSCTLGNPQDTHTHPTL